MDGEAREALGVEEREAEADGEWPDPLAESVGEGTGAIVLATEADGRISESMTSLPEESGVNNAMAIPPTAITAAAASRGAAGRL
ncbi:hypothetical protein [Streptomyces xanthophaeus]|uniref:Uncharacterized protein n=1 Tax=Streptomyces xanthophaeus TaxID=67385 RepID=A0A919GV80_9ACTN|nr:hypothetical protein [Streptomyces xanthophaeus]GHI85513.1 hypothetical protein Sxan_28770 [Streptomyces xanthophaeus]